MAEQKEEVPVVNDEEEDEMSKNYKPPAEKSVDEILKTDAEDESLRKYKESLGLTGSVIVDENDPRQVIFKKVSILAAVEDGQEKEIEIDLKPGAHNIIKEGCMYKIKIYFYAQREIVSGLKYVQKTTRKGIKVESSSVMLGSYAPREEMHIYITKPEEAPTGMLARGTYRIKSKFIDDDKKEHAEWEWQLEIKKNWEK